MVARRKKGRERDRAERRESKEIYIYISFDANICGTKQGWRRRKKGTERLGGREKHSRGPFPLLGSVFWNIPFSSFLRVSPASSPLPGKKRHLVQTITPVPGAIGHQQRVKAVAITNSDSLIPFTSTFLPLPTFLAYQRHLAPSLPRSVSAPPASPPLLGMARFHSLFPSFHPFPRHRPTTLSFHRSDFLLLVSTDVVPIYIRAGRYRKSNFVTSHQPGQDSAPLFRRNYTLAESRSLERFSLIKPTLPPKSAPLLHFCATERRQNSFSDSKTFPPLSLPLSLCVFSAQFRRGNSRNSRVSLELLISYTG